MWTTWTPSPSSAPPAARPTSDTRYLLAAGLLRTSALLLRAAGRLQQRPAATPVAAPEALEFHAEAGAPEGALYVDGRLAGWLTGVTRL